MSRLGVLWATLPRTLVLAALVLASIYPLWFMVQSSLKSNRELRADFWGLPRRPRWDNYQHAYRRLIDDEGEAGAPRRPSPLFNTALVVGASVPVTLLVAAPAAFAFARCAFPGRELLYLLVLAQLMVPGILTLVPSFVLVKELGLFNSRWGLVLPYVATGQVLAIFLLRAQFESLPASLFEAARLDGASLLQLLRRVALPLSAPMLVTVALLETISIWNDFVWPLVIVGGEETLHTITIALSYYATQYNIEFGRLMAGYILGSLPLVLLILLLLRYFLRGVLSGAVKG